MDAVLHDLQEAADRWSAQIGVDIRPRSRFSLQAALPLVRPAVELSIPRPPGGPGGLMTWVTLGA